jgi:hypothetical protein
VAVGSLTATDGAYGEVVFVIRLFVMGMNLALSRLRLRWSRRRRASSSCSLCQAEAVSIPNDCFIGEGNCINNLFGLGGSPVGRESSRGVDGHVVERCSDVSGRLRSNSKGGVGVGSSGIFESEVIISI